ncbi:MAG: hypothetical protein RBT74_07715 [Tenuifilaceae bacterium]|jgi:hypothetical protein|nr:hypothetical protein [Tenuifilaceae bacterium]
MPENETTSKTSPIQTAVMAVIYFAGFAWIIYSSDKLWVKILFGVLGLFLLVGTINRIRGKDGDDEE